MKYKKLTTSIGLLMLGIGGLQAQEATITSGGSATGSGGSSSYTVGQAFYATSTGSIGSVQEGVQQPYEISIVNGDRSIEIDFGLTAHPNPTTKFLTLSIKDAGFLSLSYQLLDLQGKTLMSSRLSSASTRVDMENLRPATYLLTVTKDDQLVKTFKIIKH